MITRPENNSQFCYIHDPDHTMIELVFHARRAYPPVPKKEAAPVSDSGVPDSGASDSGVPGSAGSAEQARAELAAAESTSAAGR